MSKASTTLRAALEKHGFTHELSSYNEHFDDYKPAFQVVLEAMEQHRREGIEEVEAWVDGRVSDCRNFDDLKAKLAALKTSGLTTSEK